jgi:hypothetical protein
MLKDDAGGPVGMSGDGGENGGGGRERRRALRRRLPFGRGAVLVVGERAHIVGVADLSVTGAYLTTRAPVSAGETHVLRILLLPARVELALRAEVVRVSIAAHESPDHPRGVAVRFLDPDEEATARLQAFVAREPRLPRGTGGDDPAG